ncbi:DUF1804 family protein [Burkholderiaceae bacterium UC74_6]
MTHPTERRRQLRGLYVFKRLAMDAACKSMGIAKSTGVRWKNEARAEGDDWDTARAATAMGEESFGQLSRQLLEDYLTQHQAMLDALKKDDKLTAMQRADILASASDSFNKTMASFKRLSPELNKQAIALDVLQRLAAFSQQRYPKHVPALLEMLEPFGEELAKAFG